MLKIVFICAIFFSLVCPSFLFAGEGFIGENPGLDFYSKIDENNYKILQKTVTRRLQETPTLDIFAKGCVSSSEILQGIITSPELLQEIEELNYENFYKKLAENIKKNPKIGGSISTDLFLQLTTCLTNNFREIKSQSQRENNARLTISYLGLYMDGDKSNSEYDIVSDIEKINSILFSTDIVYAGTANKSSKSLAAYFANKPIPSLFVSATGADTGSSDLGDVEDSDGDGISDEEEEARDASLADLLGGVCTTDMSSPVSLTDMVDATFTQELERIRGGDGNGGSVGGGFTPVVGLGGNERDLTLNPTIAATSAGDFFHTMPCDGVFCVKTKMIPGGGFKLGGGKNISIEGILDDYSAHILNPSESSLGCEVMTNNAGSFTKKGLNLFEVMAGGKIMLSNKAQISRRDKKEATPEREAEELKDIMRCGYASVGLPTDEARSRSIGGAGFMSTRGATTESINNKTSPLGPQETAEISRYTECVESHMQNGRKSYYDSFSTDVTEVQAYTASMLTEINNIMVILTAMNDKKVGCTP